MAVGCSSGDLRLTNTSSGILQICKNKEWRAVCSRDWGHVDAAVACRQLGYDGILVEIFVLLIIFQWYNSFGLQEATLKVPGLIQEPQ